jgi:hypothetical protein
MIPAKTTSPRIDCRLAITLFAAPVNGTIVEVAEALVLVCEEVTDTAWYAEEAEAESFGCAESTTVDIESMVDTFDALEATWGAGVGVG